MARFSALGRRLHRRDPASAHPSRLSRLLAHTAFEDHGYPLGMCWVWTGHARRGYGRVYGTFTYRVGYEEFVGVIPAGLEMDHGCRVTLCWNPTHVEPVTHVENILRVYPGASWNWGPANNEKRDRTNDHPYDRRPTDHRRNHHRRAPAVAQGQRPLAPPGLQR